MGSGSRSVARAGDVTLRLKPSHAARRALAARRRLKVTLRIAFTPRTGPAPSEQVQSVTLRRR